MTDNKAAVLVVCLGNICRSPLGEALLRHHAETAGLATAITVDSAGTAGWHEGKPPSHGSIEAAARNGLDITGQRSRPVVAEDFSRFDLILAMDARNLADLKASAPKGAKARIVRMMDYGTGEARDVPDPYGEPIEAFLEVFAMIDRAARGAIERLAATRGLQATSE